MKDIKPTIYISGASGYIGSFLLEKLKKNDILVKSIKKNDYNNIKEANKSILIYLSQPSSVNYQFNHEDILTLKKILSFKWLHIIYFSTALLNMHIYKYKKKKIPDYLKLKQKSEIILKNRKKTILRLSNVYGNKLKKNTFLHKLNRLKTKKEILQISNENHLRDFIHLNDILSCIIKIIKYKPNLTLNLASGKSITTNDLIILMSNNNSNIMKYLKLIKFKKNTDTSLKVDINKTKKILRWSPLISLEKTLSEIK
ncbi:NAD(P)-dependent oxidoreductase [Alphaproteobacteria bacterium]|nr:NAD(P)-dependent oxidoreductase [Alphaproteobacteria bacterium]